MSTGGETARADLRGGVGWMVFGFAILALSWRMDRFETMGGTIYTAPGLVPGIFGLLLMLMGGALALRGRRGLRAGAAGEPGPLLNSRIALMLVLTLVYAALLVGRAPFLPATMVFVAAFTWAYGGESSTRRRIVTAVLSGLIAATVIVLVFERIFLVRLP
jgi:hypothetical protein